MSLIIDNTKLNETVQNAVNQSGLQAEILTQQFSEISYVSRVRFQNTVELAGEQFRPQLYVFNRNNGKSAMRVIVGLFRLVCSNGLIIPTFEGSGQSLRIIHRECKPTAAKLNQLPELLQRGLESVYDLESHVQEMQSLAVTEEQAIQVIGNLSVSDRVKDWSIKRIVRPELRREEDQLNTAWSVYNVVNEAIRNVHGFNLTAFQADSGLFQDVLDLAKAA